MIFNFVYIVEAGPPRITAAPGFNPPEWRTTKTP